MGEPHRNTGERDGNPSANAPEVASCACCGLLQRVPPLPPRHVARCSRCRTKLHEAFRSVRSNRRAAAFALAALVLYPFGVGLPMLEIRQFGHRQETSVVEGVASLFAHSEYAVGLIVLSCSVIFPLGKLLALLFLSTGASAIPGEHRAITYRLVEWTGRWGMLDVLVVAVLVAVLKLGDLVEVAPGPGALAFASVVIA